MPESFVLPYLQGVSLQQLEGKGTSLQQQLEDSDGALSERQRLANDIQETIQTKKLHPVLRTFYHRTAFQLPGDASVRISLDANLCMIRELASVSEGPASVSEGRASSRLGSSWKRSDVLCEFPFSQLSPQDIVRFPYAVLEVKLQTRVNASPPAWVQSLIEGPLVSGQQFKIF